MEKKRRFSRENSREKILEILMISGISNDSFMVEKPKFLLTHSVPRKRLKNFTHALFKDLEPMLESASLYLLFTSFQSSVYIALLPDVFHIYLKSLECRCEKPSIFISVTSDLFDIYFRVLKMEKSCQCIVFKLQEQVRVGMSYGRIQVSRWCIMRFLPHILPTPKHIANFSKKPLSLARGETLPYWFRGKFCGHVCFELPVERISFFCSH